MLRRLRLPIAVGVMLATLYAFGGAAGADSWSSPWVGWWQYAGYTACGAGAVDQAYPAVSHTYSTASTGNGCTNFVYGSYGGNAILYGRVDGGSPWTSCDGNAINADGTYWLAAAIPVQYHGGACSGKNQFVLCSKFEAWIAGAKNNDYNFYPWCTPVDSDALYV